MRRRLALLVALLAPPSIALAGAIGGGAFGTPAVGGGAAAGTVMSSGAAGGCTLPSGVEIQLKASNLALSDSDPVGTWTSTGSDTVAFTQATESKKPTYTADCSGLGLSGPCVAFDGGDTVSAALTATATQTFTVGCVFETDSAAASYHIFSLSAWFYHQSSQCRGYAGGAEIGAFQHTLASNTWTSCTMHFDAGDPIYYSSTDGLLTTDTTNDDHGANTYSTTFLGARPTDLSFFSGHIAECLFVDDDDDTTAQAMHDYFACEYSL